LIIISDRPHSIEGQIRKGHVGIHHRVEIGRRDRLFLLGAAETVLLFLRKGGNEVLLLDVMGLQGITSGFCAYPADVELARLFILAEYELGSR
jgi:hypothetical protein